MRNEYAAQTLESVRGHDSTLVDVVAVAGMVALAATVKIPLPWTPVPVTLQTLPVLAAGYAVGWRRATAGMLLYVVLGLAGAPVFAVTFGATFGYILAFIAAPWIVGRFREPWAGIAMATLTIWVVGATWLAWYCGRGLGETIVLGIVPFVPCDVAKAYVAYRIVRRLRR